MSSLLIFSKKSQIIPDCLTEGALDLLDDVLNCHQPVGAAIFVDDDGHGSLVNGADPLLHHQLVLGLKAFNN